MMKSFRGVTTVSSQGFTLLEMLVAIIIVGILSAIVAPSFLRFLAEQKGDTAQGFLRQGVQQAQIKAQQNNIVWQFSIWEQDGTIETSVHPANELPTESSWKTLDKSIQIDDETTFLSSDSVYYVRFDEKGNVRRSRLGRITISSRQFPEVKHCVVVSTLIGATRSAKSQSEPDPSYSERERFCY